MGGFDKPCNHTNTTRCDDNCPEYYNPDQNNTDIIIKQMLIDAGSIYAGSYVADDQGDKCDPDNDGDDRNEDLISLIGIGGTGGPTIEGNDPESDECYFVPNNAGLGICERGINPQYDEFCKRDSDCMDLMVTYRCIMGNSPDACDEPTQNPYIP
jgi:hypothetical protein